MEYEDNLGREKDPSSSPVTRMFTLLELIVSKENLVSLQMLAAETGIPKPTLHRMLNTFVEERLLIRQNDRRLFGVGPRLRTFAETLLMNNTQYGARRAVLRSLVQELGETCNITTLTGDEVLYLDRVDGPNPLPFHFQPSSRVPSHCSASGKLLLSQLTVSARNKLLSHAGLEPYTDNTITNLVELEDEIVRVGKQGYALDEEEFIYGLVCVAVLVPGVYGKASQCIAVQSPSVRLKADDIERVLPTLRKAADELRAIELESQQASYQSRKAAT